MRYYKGDQTSQCHFLRFSYLLRYYRRLDKQNRTLDRLCRKQINSFPALRSIRLSSLLVFGSCSYMFFWFASVDRWISHATVVRIHVDFQSNTTFLSLCIAGDHIRPEFQVFLYAITAIGRFLSEITLTFHFFRFRVITIGHAFLNQLLTIIKQGIEMIGRMREPIIGHA